MPKLFLRTGGDMPDFKIAKLKQNEMNEIKILENEIGIRLVAYQHEDNNYASLDNFHIEKIKKIEKKLNIVILAYPEKDAA